MVIGRVLAPHGIKGEVRIDYYNPDDPHLFARYRNILIQGDEGVTAFRLIAARPHKGMIIARLEGISTRDQAEQMRGKMVAVSTAELPSLPEDEYYWHEVIGMRVLTQQGEHLGEIIGILRTGSNDVYAMRCGKKEILIPAIKGVITSVDRMARTMVIRPPDGLFEEDDL